MRPDRLGLSERFVSSVVLLAAISATARLVFELARPLLPDLGFATIVVVVAWFHFSRAR